MKNLLPSIILFFFSFSVNVAFSQNRVIDSLTKILTTVKEDTNKVNILNSLSISFWKNSDYKKAMSYANDAVILAEKIKDKKGLVNSYTNIGNNFYQQGNYSEALVKYLISLKLSKEVGNKGSIARAYNNIGNVYFQQGNYPEALKNHLSSLKVAEENGDKEAIARAYNNIGNVYFQQGSYPEALENHLSSLRIAEEIKNKHIINASYNNIGNVYFQQGNNAEALKNYLASLKIKKEIGDKQGIAFSYRNIGVAYMRQGNYTEALKNLLSSLEIEKEIGNKQGITDSYISLGELYIRLGKPDEAKEYFNRGLQLSKEIGNKEGMKITYLNLGRLDSLTGNFKEAYKLHTLYSEIKDSIINEKSNRQISQLKIQYETDKKDQQIEKQNLQLQNQTLQNKILQTRIYYGIAISLAIILLFYLRSKRKKKEYESKVVSLELTALKSQLSPHFIFNALTSIKLYIDSNLETGAEYLTRFSLFIRGVLESSEEKEISLGEEMQLMEHYLELERLCLSNSLDYSITYDDSLNKEEIMIPPLITQPVIENAIWHGIVPKDKNRQLHIHNSLLGNSLIVTVSNNAISKAVNEPVFPKRKSFGIKITRERLALLKQIAGKEGNLNLEILPGETKATITIPLKEIEV